MYNKKYILKEIQEYRKHNSLYDDAEGAICYPAYFRVGERGWFLLQKNDFEWPHRIQTSVVQAVVYKDNRIIVITENTKFTFEVVDEYGLLDKSTHTGDEKGE